jgi:hypothetical protein
MVGIHHAPSLLNWLVLLASMLSVELASAAVRCERSLVANVVAFDQPLMYNRLGAQNANGMIYALRRDVVDERDVPLANGGVGGAGQGLPACRTSARGRWSCGSRPATASPINLAEPAGISRPTPTAAASSLKSRRAKRAKRTKLLRPTVPEGLRGRRAGQLTAHVGFSGQRPAGRQQHRRHVLVHRRSQRQQSCWPPGASTLLHPVRRARRRVRRQQPVAPPSAARAPPATWPTACSRRSSWCPRAGRTVPQHPHRRRDAPGHRRPCADRPAHRRLPGPLPAAPALDRAKARRGTPIISMLDGNEIITGDTDADGHGAATPTAASRPATYPLESRRQAQPGRPQPTGTVPRLRRRSSRMKPQLTQAFPGLLRRPGDRRTCSSRPATPS